MTMSVGPTYHRRSVRLPPPSDELWFRQSTCRLVGSCARAFIDTYVFLRFRPTPLVSFLPYHPLFRSNFVSCLPVDSSTWLPYRSMTSPGFKYVRCSGFTISWDSPRLVANLPLSCRWSARRSVCYCCGLCQYTSSPRVSLASLGLISVLAERGISGSESGHKRGCQSHLTQCPQRIPHHRPNFNINR